MAGTGKSRLPTPAQRSPPSPSAAAAASIGQAPRSAPASSTLPSIRSLKKAFQFGRNSTASSSKLATYGSATISGLPKSASTTALSKSLGSQSNAGSAGLKRTASGDHTRKPIPNDLRAPHVAARDGREGNSWISWTSPSPKRIASPIDERLQQTDGSKLGPIASHSSASTTSLSHFVAAEKAAGSSNSALLVTPNRIRTDESLIGKSSTPPPSMPLPPIPTGAEADASEAKSFDDQAGIQADIGGKDDYLFPYDLAAGQRDSRISITVPSELNEEARSQEANSPEPVLAESPQKSPSVIAGPGNYIFSSATVERTDSPEEDAGQAELPSEEKRNEELQASLTRLRHSSSSPLSELVTRLSLHSPTRSLHGASIKSLSTEVSPVAPTLPNGTEAESSPRLSDGAHEEINPLSSPSVAGSSGISAVPPYRAHLSPNPVRVVPLHVLDTDKSIGEGAAQPELIIPATEHQELPSQRRVSPSTQQRWSMHELEEAYTRMRSIAISRKGSGTTDAPSLILSEVEDSRDFENSYLKNLLNEVDRSELQSSQATELSVCQTCRTHARTNLSLKGASSKQTGRRG